MISKHKKAEAFLSSTDKKLARIISITGPCTLIQDKRPNPFQSLFRSIVFQQLHGKAAQTILDRTKALYAPKKFPTPEDIISTKTSTLRSCGLSHAKILSLKDLSEKTLQGIVPKGRKILTMSDDEILNSLTSIKGIGTWTVHMMLMFSLGREDVMPDGDFGVQKGYSLTYNKPHPTPKELRKFSEKWRPYRSIAAWYMWRAVDLHRDKKK